MNRVPSSDRYPASARLLHWLSAAVIVWATASGFLVMLGADSGLAASVSDVNVSLTALLVPVFALRIGLRLFGTVPAPLDVSAGERRAARIGHAALYLLTTATLLSGILMMDRDIRIFDCWVLPRPLADESLNRGFALVHRAVAGALAVMIVIHVAAVVRHERRGTRVLRRMAWPKPAADPGARCASGRFEPAVRPAAIVERSRRSPRSPVRRRSRRS